MRRKRLGLVPNPAAQRSCLRWAAVLRGSGGLIILAQYFDRNDLRTDLAGALMAALDPFLSLARSQLSTLGMALHQYRSVESGVPRVYWRAMPNEEANRLRDRAAECRELAAKCRTTETHDLMLKVAAEFEKEADEKEAAGAPTPIITEPKEGA